MRPRPLIPREDLARRVRELGGSIARDHDRDHAGRPLVLIALMDGAFCFAADLVRSIDLDDLTLVFHPVRSYRGTESTGTVACEPLSGLAGRRVLVVDDILDSGRTLATVLAAVARAGASSASSCVLLDKPMRRVDAGQATADYIGFTVPDVFVVGYGLDHDGRWRHLPDVCVI
ncbi:MAG: hypoxanthine phosphoribosyltransferase [Planctomycetes bacterium]|nr:hypoxanthine phosphoribosyltransferase [Planctomycetota bacterium]